MASRFMLSCLSICEVSVLTLLRLSICLEWLWKQRLHLWSLPPEADSLGQHHPTEISARMGLPEICTVAAATCGYGTLKCGWCD